MPNGHPKCPRFKTTQRHVEPQNLIEHRIQCVLLHFGLSLSTLRLVGQEVNLLNQNEFVSHALSAHYFALHYLHIRITAIPFRVNGSEFFALLNVNLQGTLFVVVLHAELNHALDLNGSVATFTCA